MKPIENIDDLSPEDQRHVRRRLDEEAKVRTRYDEICDRVRPDIVAQAGDDWYTFTTQAGRVLTVPRAPFLHWALTFNARHLCPPWKPCAPQGIKMVNDDVFHSDWLIGANIPILSWYGSRSGAVEEDKDLVNSAVNEQWNLQAEMLGFQAHILSGTGKTRKGYVYHPEPNKGIVIDPKSSHYGCTTAIVIPHAGPEYLQAAMEIHAVGGAVITEKGGAMAHLVNDGRENNLRIVRVPDARKLYPAPWTQVTVDCDRGKVEIELP